MTKTQAEAKAWREFDRTGEPQYVWRWVQKHMIGQTASAWQITSKPTFDLSSRKKHLTQELALVACEQTRQGGLGL